MVANIISKLSAFSLFPLFSFCSAQLSSMPRILRDRSIVPDDKKSWSIPWLDYRPVEWTSSSIVGRPWADSEIGALHFTPLFNQKDGQIDRRSHLGDYKVHNGYPLNPCGRTGACLRGRLGRWGPNHAADPVVTRWKVSKSGSPSCHKILSVALIRRGDTGNWALPGGMVDVGEEHKGTASREFLEETMNILKVSHEERKRIEAKFKNLFDSGLPVWKGIVKSDPRNTDNSWMESVAYHFHDETGFLNEVNLCPGDDAIHAEWRDVGTDLKDILIPDHMHMVRMAAERLSATW